MTVSPPTLSQFMGIKALSMDKKYINSMIIENYFKVVKKENNKHILYIV